MTIYLLMFVDEREQLEKLLILDDKTKFFSSTLLFVSRFPKKVTRKKFFLLPALPVNTSYEFEIKPTQRRKMTIEKLRHHSSVDVVVEEMCRTSETRSEGIQTTKLCLPVIFICRLTMT